ncbi:MAG: purine-binding chemotaxis protein CheW [Deltaproteobacteria bacterium]|nr:purine-binding chemotaxis protein CheW [Deltaproteobacteria bacterium]
MSERSGGGPGAPLRLVCFELRQQELALPIADVRETLPLQPITPVFLTPPCLAGVFSLRGDIVPVIDLGILLGLSRTVVGEESKIVVIEHGGQVAGIVVDRLRDLRTLDVALEPTPLNVPPAIASLLRGIAATATGSVRVLDVQTIFEAEPLRALAAERAPQEGRQ